MRILYLVHFEQDYLQEMIFAGLCSLLGENNIYMYPMLRRFKYNEPDNTYILDDGKTGFTSVPKYLRQYPDLPELNLDEICRNINDFDYIFFFPRSYSIKSLRYIKAKCPIITAKLIFLDGEDGFGIREDLVEEFNPDFIFKRELMHQTNYKGKNAYPLPFAAFTDMLPKEDDNVKDIDVFGIFGNTNILRVEMVKKFHELDINNSIVDIDIGTNNMNRNYPRQGKMSYEEYMKRISHSKISLGCRGHGCDTVRFGEIPSYNTMMMCLEPKIIIPFPFKDRYECVIIKDDLSNFEELLRYYLSHDNERKMIANAGHNHLIKYHTCEKRVMYMLSILEGNI